MLCFEHYRIGIDAESIKTDRDCHAAAALFMSTEELNHLPDSDTAFHQYFYRLWCAKEALYKALPASTQKKAALASLSYTDLKKERTEWHLCETQIAATGSQ